MKRISLLLLLVLAVQSGFAQLTTTQKIIDFQGLVSLFDKRYAFIEWKRDAVGFDGLNLVPWMDRINQSKDDLSFFEICAEYVAKYQDGHSGFSLQSTYEATLGFTVDIYDGKVLIDSIDRTVLKDTDFPFQIGDELVSVDGKSADDWIKDLSRFVSDGNPRSARRDAADLIVDRIQAIMPRAHEIGDTAAVMIRRQNGDVQSFTIPWAKTGRPYISAGPVPDPKTSSARATAKPMEESGADDDGTPAYLRHLRELQLQQRRSPVHAVTGSDGSRVKPLFDLPASFVQRLGSGHFDSIFSGSFDAGSLKIAYIRIPVLSGVTRDFQNEIKFFLGSTAGQPNSDGLIIDVMRNPGGNVCTTEDLTKQLMPDTFNVLGFKYRATWNLVIGTQQDLDDAIASDGDPQDIAQLQTMLKAFQDAYGQSRGLTIPLALCSSSLSVDPAKDRTGKIISYNKPIMILTDEFSASAAETLAAILQDGKRATVYGMRTNGAGGTRGDYNVGFFMETEASLARAIGIRSAPIQTSDYPAAPYIENIGVRPDQTADYMTKDNLLNNGKPFVDGFTAAMVKLIQSSN